VELISYTTFVEQKQTDMTLQDLKNRKSYIIAKITNIAGAENVSRYMDLMLFLQPGFEGTIYDLIMDVHSQLRERTKRSGQKLAEIVGNNEKRTYSIMDKKFIYNK
jgi:hypothetical protein